MLDYIIHKFHEGGIPVMLGILITLLMSVAIVIERCLRYWLKYDCPNSLSFMNQIEKMIRSNSIENAVRMCKTYKGLLPYVLSEGLKRANDTVEEFEQAIEEAVLDVTPRINRTVPFLGTAANVSTLIGLLGTIFGLMKSFGGAAKATGAEKQTILAEGIGEALTATSFGLTTALLCLFFHGLLVMKQQAMISDIHYNVAKLNNLLFTRKIKLEEKD